MEKKSIITGKTLEEAKANVTAQLGLDADSYSYQVVQMPKSGFLGFGAQPAKIEVTYEVPDPVPEAPKVALSSASRSKPKPVAKKGDGARADGHGGHDVVINDRLQDLELSFIQRHALTSSSR